MVAKNYQYMAVICKSKLEIVDCFMDQHNLIE